jgi:DnaJ-class molecular chaperone
MARRQCPACKREMFGFFASGEVTCKRCGGSGKIDSLPWKEGRECSACQGTGRVTCTQCQGTGYIDD